MVLLLIGLCAMWGAQQVTVKLAIAGGWPPVMMAALRSVIAGGCLIAWVALREGRLAALIPRRTAILPALLIGLGFAGEFVTLYPGLRLTTASRGVVFLYTQPFFTAAGAHLFLGERLRSRQVMGLLLAFAGVAAAFAGGFVSGGGSILGDLLCAAAALMWSANTLLVKGVRVLREAGPSAVLLWQIAGSVPVLAVFSWALAEPAPHPSVLAWGFLLYQSVAVAFASYLAWFWIILRYPAGQVSGFTFMTPVFGILAGVVVQGDPVGASLIAGAVAIALGLRLLNGPG